MDLTVRPACVDGPANDDKADPRLLQRRGRDREF